MSDIALRVEGVSKQFQLGRKRERYKTFRDTCSQSFLSPIHLISRFFRGKTTKVPQKEIIWALQDMSFEVRHGEVVGIIGRNGAGKSTLLKIISRITEPTKGFVEIYGRASSLLEVGTGFHPELTGRENIYLNGAIMGMKRAEIDKKFDEIVAFAEVEKFVDTPVKHYSSGMYLRLAFGVAAHLEPEILIVDEVLAVGDARFQKKCFNKMQEAGKSGRTVLFVSHNMPAIARMCERTILLEDGRIKKDGTSHEVVSVYLSSGTGTTAERVWTDTAKAPAGEITRLCAVRIRDEHNQVSNVIDIRKPVYVEMEYEVLKEGYTLLPHYQFFNEEGIEAFVTDDLDPDWRRRSRPVGHWISTVCIPGNYLSEGTLFVKAGVCSIDPIIMQFSVPDVVAFQVIDSMEGDSVRGDWPLHFGGVVRPFLKWSTQFIPNGKGNGKEMREKVCRK